MKQKTAYRHDKAAHKQTEYYKKRILARQENIKLFLPLSLLVGIVLLVFNVKNLIGEGGNAGVSLLINLVGLTYFGVVGVRFLLGTKQAMEYTEKIRRGVYGEIELEYGTEYEVMEIAEIQPPIGRIGARVRLYTGEESSLLVADGIDEYKKGLVTRYDYKKDFGRLVFDPHTLVEEDGERLCYESEGFRLVLNKTGK